MAQRFAHDEISVKSKSDMQVLFETLGFMVDWENSEEIFGYPSRAKAEVSTMCFQTTLSV